MTFTLIVNPVAGGGRASKVVNPIVDILESAEIACEVRVSGFSGHAVALAEEAAATADAVIAVGGDGTIQETARGLLNRPDNDTPPLGIIPAGTGNDLAKPLGIPLKPKEAVRALVGAHLGHIDYGLCTCTTNDGKYERIFLNALGTGFDAQVAYEAHSFKKLRGTAAYAAAIIRTLRAWRAPHLSVAANGFTFDGECLLVTTANGTCQGGGFYLTPDAKIDDGRLDLCLIESIPRLRILPLLGTAMKGRHLSHEKVHLNPVKSVHIAPRVPTPVHADGEVITHEAIEVSAEIVPRGLTVLRP